MVYSQEVQQLLILNDDLLPLQDYSALGLTVDHAAELIRMATDSDLLKEDSANFWSAIHAWYALGELKVIDAVEPLLDLIVQHPYDLLFDQDLCNVFVSMGKEAIPRIQAYINNLGKPLLAREMCCHFLEALGQTYRVACIDVLNKCLERADINEQELNGGVVASLMELEAVESIDIIRQAFHLNRVDINIPGDLQDVEIDLGLRKKRETSRPHYNSGFFGVGGDEAPEPITLPSKVGRNDPCPCGSGKKYKKCCLH